MYSYAPMTRLAQFILKGYEGKETVNVKNVAQDNLPLLFTIIRSAYWMPPFGTCFIPVVLLASSTAADSAFHSYSTKLTYIHNCFLIDSHLYMRFV